MKTLEETFSAELARCAPDLGTTEIASYTAAALACGAYSMRDGKLTPGAPEAIRQASFLPKAFVRAQAQAAADAETSPLAKTHAWARAMGGKDFESVLMGSPPTLPETVAKMVAEQPRWSEKQKIALGLHLTDRKIASE